MEPSTRIIKAEFRPATEQEVKEAKGGWLYSTLTLPWSLISKIFGTYQMWNNKTDISLWKIRLPQNVVNLTRYLTGSREHLFLREFNSFLGRIHFIESEMTVGKAFFKHHRNNEIFTSSSCLNGIFEMIKYVFPEENFDVNDFMLTCDKERTEQYRMMLIHYTLKSSYLKDFKPILQKIIDNTLEEWFESQNNEGLNITYYTKLYASTTLSALMFGKVHAIKNLTECIIFFNNFIIKTTLKAPSEEDNQDFIYYSKLLNSLVSSILKKEDLPIFEDQEITSAQKKAMIFTLLFAGQEKMSAILSYILWQLALDPEKQEELYEIVTSEGEEKEQLKVVRDLFTESIRKFPPAFSIARTTARDTCLEYQFADEETLRKKIIFKGEGIILNSAKFAEKLTLSEDDHYNGGFVFGEGPNQCPGKKLALTEVTEFIASLIKKYTIKTTQMEVESAAMFTQNFTEPLSIYLLKR